METMISCVMPCFNENLIQIRRSINSILNQSYSNFEFIIILDNPKNKILYDEINKFKKKDTRINFLVNKKNMGKAFTRNKGIYKAKGKYVALMDADDYSYKQRFKIQLSYMERNSKIDVLFPSYRQIFPSGKILTYSVKKYDLKKTFFSGFGHLNGGLFARREVFKKNKYVLPNYPEEFELFIRMIKSNINFWTCPEILYDYIVAEKEENYNFMLNSKGSYQMIKLLIKNINIFLFWKGYIYTLFRTLLVLIVSRNKYLFNIVYKFSKKINY